MLACEPIVLFLSLLSGFSDALIFTFLQSFGPVLGQWGFGVEATGVAFVSSVSSPLLLSSTEGADVGPIV